MRKAGKILRLLENVSHAPVFFISKLKHAVVPCLRSVLNDSYLLEARYGKCPRFHAIKNVHTGGYTLGVPDAASFVNSWHELFERKIYSFIPLAEKPVILAIGANIGLSVLFFKKYWPDSKITAFEADPNIFNYLKLNLENNGVCDVDVVNKAVWTIDGKMHFSGDGADGGRIDTAGGIEVECVDVCRVMDGFSDIDFLKLDIEGAETDVLLRIGNKLSRVKYLFIEYHSRIDSAQSLGSILSVLVENGFRYDIHNIHECPDSPFLNHSDCNGFDLQLNIFAKNTKNGLK